MRIPCSLLSRYSRTGSMPKLNSSMAKLSPCLKDCLLFFTALPTLLLTVTSDTLSSYRFLYREITCGLMPFFRSTWKHQVVTMLQKAAFKSVSRIPHPGSLLPVRSIASLAMAIPWNTRFLPPDTRTLIFMTIHR